MDRGDEQLFACHLAQETVPSGAVLLRLAKRDGIVEGCFMAAWQNSGLAARLNLITDLLAKRYPWRRNGMKNATVLLRSFSPTLFCIGAAFLREEAVVKHFIASR